MPIQCFARWRKELSKAQVVSYLRARNGFEMTALLPNINHTQSETKSFIKSRRVDFAVNISILAALWLAYSAVRGVTADELSIALGNASEILRVQELMGLPSELSFQQSFLDRTGLLKGANIYYIAIHFPVTIAFLGWIWLKHRDRFSRIRNTLVGVTTIGLLLHVTFPLAPPRMVEGFVDTAALLGPNPYDLEVASAANQIAAMPSLHVGWSVLVAIGIIWVVKSKWSLLALAHPVLTTLVVVVTANHYWTDAIVAAALVLTWWIVSVAASGKQNAAKAAPIPERACG